LWWNPKNWEQNSFCILANYSREGCGQKNYFANDDKDDDNDQEKPQSTLLI
jgi:hypothetical protein